MSRKLWPPAAPRSIVLPRVLQLEESQASRCSKDKSYSMSDAINPTHYRAHPSGVECIAICEHFNFSLGNAIKYIWRSGLKSDNPIEDLKKARWYIDREIARLEKKT